MSGLLFAIRLVINASLTGTESNEVIFLFSGRGLAHRFGSSGPHRYARGQLGSTTSFRPGLAAPLDRVSPGCCWPLPPWESSACCKPG